MIYPNFFDLVMIASNNRDSTGHKDAECLLSEKVTDIVKPGF
jgi:hypothetical protein